MYIAYNLDLTLSNKLQSATVRPPHHQNRKPSAQPPARRKLVTHPCSDWRVPQRYQLRQLIGAGSYGHVCEAYDIVEQKVVAIKRIHRVFHDLVDCKRILREIAILNRLHHENVVQTCDICIPQDLKTFDELYLVLEIADSDLKKLFKTPIYLTELHVIVLLYNLLVGLKYIHSAGIYHRDLKPANCLVNQDCTIKICDFGLARTIDESVDPHYFTSKYHSHNEQCTSSQLSADKVHKSHNNTYSSMSFDDLEKKRYCMKRQLTGHVVTRWYRAPELILLQEHYTEAIDVWSVGCIFAELLGMMKENVQSHLERGPLFPGSSCFPLSPDNKLVSEPCASSNSYTFHTKENQDQLSIIFNLIGTPSEEDTEALEKQDAKTYIKLFPYRQRINLAQRFPGASLESIALLERMLVFNPFRRIKVDEALESPLFRDVRCKVAETVAKTKVQLPFDDWKPMNEQQLRSAFTNEIYGFHPNIRLPTKFPSAPCNTCCPSCLTPQCSCSPPLSSALAQS